MTAFRVLLEVPVAIATTIAALRLLGARRSWTAALAAGLVGWIAGNLMAYDLAGGRSGAVGVSGTTVVFGVLFTVLGALVLDFFARPGSLARGERAGLVRVPRPLRDLHRHFAPYVRYRELLALARANGLVQPMLRRRRRGDRPPFEVALRRTLEQAGVVFVKLGQVASTRADLVPDRVRDELSRLQSEAEAAPPEAMRQQIESELGAPVEQLFAEFDWMPIGRASIAQVYGARLPTGESVVVKVQRPGAEEVVRRDTAALLQLARVIERTPQGRELHVSEVASEFVESLRQEMDFRREAANARMLATASRGSARVPHVYERLVTRRVLVEERFEGTPLSIGRRSAGGGIEDKELANRLVATMVTQIQSGVYHADPHPGNVVVLDDGTLGLIDFGAVGHLDRMQRSAVIQLTTAAFTGDATGMREAIQTLATVGDDVSDIDLERALAHLVSEHSADDVALNAGALADMLPLLAAFNIHVPAELTTFVRALVVLDGTLAFIRPGYSVTNGIRELVDGGLLRRTAARAVVGEELRRTLVAELPRLSKLPAHLDRIATLIARGELRTQVSLFSTERDARVVTTLVNRMVLVVAGGLLAIGSALLLALAPTAAVGVHASSLTAPLGFLGLGAAAVLLLRVVAAVVREGYN